MATIKDINVIYDEMLFKNIVFYKVIDSDNRTVLTSNMDKEVTPTDAVKMLKEFLEKVDGIVYIQLSQKAGTDMAEGGNIKNQVFKYQVRLGDAAAGKTISGPSESSGSLQMQINQMQQTFEAKLDKLKMEYEHKKVVDDMQKQIDELKKGDDIQGYGLQLLEKIVAGNGGAPPGMAGVGTETNIHGQTLEVTGIGTINPENRQARLQGAIRTIASVDKEYLEHIEMIAELAKSKPIVYWGAIEQLKKL